jgi:hypothetical protein
LKIKKIFFNKPIKFFFSNLMSTTNTTSTGESDDKPLIFSDSCDCNSGGCFENSSTCRCISLLKTCTSNCGCALASKCRNSENNLDIPSVHGGNNLDDLITSPSSTVPSSNEIFSGNELLKEIPVQHCSLLTFYVYQLSMNSLEV